MEQITITGHLGRDAEVKQTGDNFYLNFSIAVSRKFTNKTGEQIEKTNWYSVFKWSKKHPARLCEFLKKGQKVLVQGEPSYELDQHSQQIRVNVIINAQQLEVLTFDTV